MTSGDALGMGLHTLAGMPTPAERKALFFLSGLMLLGSGVRASAALSGAEREPGVGAGQPALERQIAAVDTARARSSSKKSSSRKKPRKATGSSTRSTRPVSSSTGGTVTGESWLSDRMAVSASDGDVRTTVYYTATKPGKIDVDVADAAGLER